jgi:hypothetical protein
MIHFFVGAEIRQEVKQPFLANSARPINQGCRVDITVQRTRNAIYCPKLVPKQGLD